jgi:hypothetical protein
MAFYGRLEWNSGRQSKTSSQMSAFDWLRAQILLVRARFQMIELAAVEHVQVRNIHIIDCLAPLVSNNNAWRVVPTFTPLGPSSLPSGHYKPAKSFKTDFSKLTKAAQNAWHFAPIQVSCTQIDSKSVNTA